MLPAPFWGWVAVLVFIFFALDARRHYRRLCIPRASWPAGNASGKPGVSEYCQLDLTQRKIVLDH